MQFIEKKYLKSVFDENTFHDMPNELYDFFMNNDSEIVYIFQNERIKGVISIGDLERFYRSDGLKLVVNQNYMYLRTISYNDAENFFSTHATINEIPVIIEEKYFIGIIKIEKEVEIRKKQRNSLNDAYWISQYYRNEIKRFIKNTKAKVFLFGIDSEKIMKQYPEAVPILRERVMRKKNGEGAFGLTDKEWQDYWKEDYYPGIGKALEQEYRNLVSVKEYKGIYEFKDTKGFFYSFYNGCRVTTGISEKTDRKIHMYGPCLVAGGVLPG